MKGAPDSSVRTLPLAHPVAGCEPSRDFRLRTAGPGWNPLFGLFSSCVPSFFTLRGPIRQCYYVGIPPTTGCAASKREEDAGPES